MLRYSSCHSEICTVKGPSNHTVKKYATSLYTLAKCAAGGRREGWLAAAPTCWGRQILTQIEYKLGRIWRGGAGTLVKHLTGMKWSKDPSKMMFVSIWFPKKKKKPSKPVWSQPKHGSLIARAVAGWDCGGWLRLIAGGWGGIFPDFLPM